VSKTLIPAERRQRIRAHLAVHQAASNAALSALLGVSEATIRRDLEWLEAEGVVERSHGGAALALRLPFEPEYAKSVQSHPDEKRRIGQRAAALIEDGETIFVNSGTTTTQLIRHIRPGAQITVITNNLTAALEAGETGYELLLLGGAYRARAHSVAGRFATDMLRQVYASRCFLGVDGLSARRGCTTPNSAEAEIARLMLERTHGPVIVIADHSKWGVVSNFDIAGLEQVQTLVTDDGLDAAARDEIAARGVQVLVSARQGPSGAAATPERRQATVDRRRSQPYSAVK
jgi:DeoR family fructose operon transcriptional repressor